MFDVGLSELVVIGIVALVVIGPERLPKVARTVGHLIGRLQRYVAGVKADIAREMELEELRKFKSEMEGTARSIASSVQQEISLAEQEIKVLEQETGKVIDADSPSSELSEPAAEAPPSPQMELSLDTKPAPGQTNQ